MIFFVYVFEFGLRAVFDYWYFGLLKYFFYTIRFFVIAKLIVVQCQASMQFFTSHGKLHIHIY